MARQKTDTMRNGGREALSFHATTAQRTMRMGQAAARQGAQRRRRCLHGCRRNGAIRPSWPPPADLGDGMRGRGRRRGYKKCRPTGDQPGGRHHERRRHPTLPHCSAVPSAQPGLTSLFGMGRGGTPAQWPPVFSFALPKLACVAHSTQESSLPAGT